MAVAGKLTYDTDIDKKGFEKGIKKLENVSKEAFKGIALATATVTASVTAIGTAAVKSYADLEQNIGGIETLFKDSADIVKKYANEAYKTAGLSANEYMSTATSFSASLLQSLKGDTKKASEYTNRAIIDMSDNANKMGTSMESLQFAYQGFAKQNYTMLDNLKLGYGGTKTEMERLIKDSSKMKDIQKELNVTVKDGDLSFGNIVNAISVMQKKLEITGTTAKEAEATISGSISSLKAAWDNFLNGSGNFDQVVESAKIAFKNITKAAGQLLPRIIKEIGKSLDEALKKAGFIMITNQIHKLQSKFKELYKTIKSGFTNFTQNKKLVEQLERAISNFAAAIKVAIISLIAYKTALAISTLITKLKLALEAATASEWLMYYAQKALNLIMSANPVVLLATALVGLTAAAFAFSKAQNKSQLETQALTDKINDQKQSMDEARESIDKNMNENLAQISSVRALKDELSNLVDENGKVKKGYESRVAFILNELNNALGTEYKLNGDIIQGYKALKKEIDGVIEKKRAQIYLEAYEEKYRDAIKNETQAVNNLREAQEKLGSSIESAKVKYNLLNNTLDEKQKKNSSEYQSLKNLIDNYDKSADEVKRINEDKKRYEDSYALFVQGKYDEIGSTINASTENWGKTSLDTLTNNLREQGKSLESYTTIVKNNGSTLAEELKKQSENNIASIANELISRTSTIGELGQQEIDAWKQLALSSVTEYSNALSQMSPEMQQKIQESTGVLKDDATMSTEASIKGQMITNSFEKNVKINDKLKNEIENTSQTAKSDVFTNQAGKDLADKANRGFNDNVDGNTWGSDLTKNISAGMTSLASRILVTNAAQGIAGIISNYLHHSVPDKGPLKDELTYMPDMIDNLVYGINSNKKKVEKASESVAESIKTGLALKKIDNMNTEIISKMHKAVSLETGSINATASVKSNNSMLNILQASFNIDGSVDIDGKSAGRIIAPHMTKTYKVMGVS